ncbi:hypothetical protein [Christiangramia echinicola]|uniref:hypothetical protein n=1 Tax=Christiangramia echinicola TaxID=279359 RepID=UPI00041EC31A|nr:hypothetical protein [Christiangramia echinicola]
MEKELVNHIKFKTAITLNILLNQAKSYSENQTKDIATSQGKIASFAVLRKATVTNILNAKTNPSTATLILIVEAMGFTIKNFAEVYESIGTSNLRQLAKQLNNLKAK